MNAAARALRAALLRGQRRPPLIGTGAPIGKRGDGYEFAELRAYIPGDDPRRIDWAATARAGMLQTRVMLEEFGLTLAALVDCSPSMEVGKTISARAAARSAISAWYGTAIAQDRCVVVDDREIFSPARLRGAASARVAAVRIGDGATRAFNLQRALKNAELALARGSALLVVSDFWDLESDPRAILAPPARRFDCTALLVRDPWRERFPLRGFVRMHDVETGDRRTLFVGTRTVERYGALVERRERELGERFRSCGWRFGIIDEASPERGLYAAFGIAA